MGNWTLQHLNKNVLIKMLEEKENNWNELKEWLEDEVKLKHLFEYDCAIKDVIYIMQEIESRK